MATHGSSGPVQVSPGGHRTDIGEQFLEMAVKYDHNRSFAKDINDFRTCDAYGVCFLLLYLEYFSEYSL